MNPMQAIDDAAALLNSLSDESAAAVLSRMDDDVHLKLAQRMASFQAATGNDLNRITRRFRDAAFLKDSGQRAQIIARAAQDSLLWSDATGSAQQEPFAFLKYLESDIRRSLLESEHPANLAMMLATLEPAFASAITSELDPMLRVSVVQRLCEIDIVDDAKLMELRFQLRMRAKKLLAIANCRPRGIEVAARLLSLSDRHTRDGVMDWLSGHDSQLADQVQRRVVTIDSLETLDEEQMSKLLRRVDTSAWAGALRSTRPSIAARVLKSMVPRAAEIVSAEMAQFDPLDENATQWAIEQVVSAMLELQK